MHTGEDEDEEEWHGFGGGRYKCSRGGRVCRTDSKRGRRAGTMPQEEDPHLYVRLTMASGKQRHMALQNVVAHCWMAA